MNSLFKVSAKNHAGMILMTILALRESRPAYNTAPETLSRKPGGRVPRTALDEVYVSLKDVAGEMGLSVKFLEEIAAVLKKAKLIEGRKGPGGGYRLAKPAKNISAHDILVALEGPVSAMSCDGAICPVADKCASKSLWGFLHKDLIESLKNTSLKQITNKR